jgi:3-polyprenyl-4-hydroxybenzoate decarboxylase
MDPDLPRVRAGVVRIVDREDTILVIGPRLARQFAGDSAELLRAVLEIHVRPVTRSELFVALTARVGRAFPSGPVDDLVAVLVEDGVLVPPRPAAAPAFLTARRVVVGITGAIAAVDAPSLIRGLHALGCDVRVALSGTAPRFVAVEALEALTHHAVWTSLWQRDARTPVPHIALAEWAELVVVAPTSATSLARIATGDCSDLVPAVVCATRAPVVLVPSMNDAMYRSPAVQANLETVRTHGRWLVHPALGLEMAERPDERQPQLGGAPPASAVVDIVRHLLGELAPTRRLPTDAAAWESLWSTTPVAHLAWHADDVEPALAEALDARHGPGKTLLDLGTGTGTVAIAAARRGFRVTATDIAPTALGRARDRVGELPIAFALDDVTRTRLHGAFDVVVDCGLLHCLPPDRWPAYATAVTGLVAPGGALLVVAHTAGGAASTHPISVDELATLLPGFAVVRSTPTTLARTAAALHELERAP